MPKSTRARGRSRTPQSVQTGAFEFIIHPHRRLKATLPFVIVGHLVRGRTEIALLIAVVLAYAGLASILPAWGVCTVLAALLVLLIAVGPTRRFVIRRYWCVVSRHRVRACFRSSWTMTYDGTLPYLLWSRPTPVGERIRVWLPAGLAAENMEAVTDKLAVACWAREARIEHGRKCAASAVIHIIRRDPLETGNTLVPDVLGQVPTQPATEVTLTPLPTREQASAQVAIPIERVNPGARSDARSGTARSGKGTARTSNARQNTSNDASEPMVVGYDGTDVSDYV